MTRANTLSRPARTADSIIFNGPMTRGMSAASRDRRAQASRVSSASQTHQGAFYSSHAHHDESSGEFACGSSSSSDIFDSESSCSENGQHAESDAAWPTPSLSGFSPDHWQLFLEGHEATLPQETQDFIIALSELQRAMVKLQRVRCKELAESVKGMRTAMNDLNHQAREILEDMVDVLASDEKPE